MDKKKWQHLGSVSSAILETNFKLSATITHDPEHMFVPKGGRGAKVWDEGGNEYYCCNSSAGVANTGYNHPEVVAEIHRHIEDELIFYINNDFPNSWAVKLMEKLVEITPGSFAKKVYFGNSGTEAVEAALKLLESHRGKERPFFLTCEGAFHGRTKGALALNRSQNVHRRGYDLSQNVITIPFPNDPRDYPGRLEDSLNKSEKLQAYRGEYREDMYVDYSKINALFIEMIQGEGGIRPADPEALSILMDFCREYDIKVVVDEVQTGFGRTGRMFASDHYGIEPDVICLGKGLGGGFPISAIVFKSELDWTENGRHSCTFGGGNLISRVALKNIEILERWSLIININDRTLESKKYLKDLQDTFPDEIRDVRGKGLMRAVEFKNSAVKHRVVVEGMKHGLVLMPTRGSTVRMMPPLIVSKNELSEIMKRFKKTLKNVL